MEGPVGISVDGDKGRLMKTTTFKPVQGAVLAMMALALPAIASSEQIAFNTAEKAADALVIAVARGDQESLKSILGDDYQSVMPTDAIGEKNLDRFFAGWVNFHAIVAQDQGVRRLAVGEHGWTLPIPIQLGPSGWYFDTQAGAEEIRARRIGRNELAAMQAALAYRDAQLEYMQADRDGDQVLEYAQKFKSAYGQRDGLYWPSAESEPESPLGALFAGDDEAEGYHGYHYRILTGQGPAAAGGEKSYLENGNLTGGFGLIAWPVDYGQTGVMSFMMDKEGGLYEADLGADSRQIASEMAAFNPVGSWSVVDKAAIEGN